MKIAAQAVAPAGTQEQEILRETVWLTADYKSRTAHAFDDYLQTPHGPFLGVLSFCGVRRDPSTRVPADMAKCRVCSRCSLIHERRERRDQEYREALAKYGEGK